MGAPGWQTDAPETGEAAGATERVREAAGDVARTFTVWDDVRAFVRRRPAVALLGAALGGVVAGRLIRSAVGARTEDSGTEVAQRSRGRAEGNLLAAGLIGFGTGWLVSSLLPPPEAVKQAAAKVQDVVKDRGQPVADKVQEAVSDVRERMNEAAQEAVESVKRTASEAARKVADDVAPAARKVAADAAPAARKVAADAAPAVAKKSGQVASARPPGTHEEDGPYS